MSDEPPENRSFEGIEPGDLSKLADIAASEFDRICTPPRKSAAFAGRLRVLCLCQGSALHLKQTIDGASVRRGINDFDVWGFFEALPESRQRFAVRTIWERDFGPSKFGRSPSDTSRRVGRKVDVIGRAIAFRAGVPVAESVVDYLRTGPGRSPGYLRKRPVFIISPGPDFGRMIWPGI